MNAEEFYRSEDCESHSKYDETDEANWLFGRYEMELFAESYHEAKLKLLNLHLVDSRRELLSCEGCVFHNTLNDSACGTCGVDYSNKQTTL